MELTEIAREARSSRAELRHVVHGMQAIEGEMHLYSLLLQEDKLANTPVSYSTARGAAGRALAVTENLRALLAIAHPDEVQPIRIARHPIPLSAWPRFRKQLKNANEAHKMAYAAMDAASSLRYDLLDPVILDFSIFGVDKGFHAVQPFIERLHTPLDTSRESRFLTGRTPLQIAELYAGRLGTWYNSVSYFDRLQTDPVAMKFGQSS